MFEDYDLFCPTSVADLEIFVQFDSHKIQSNKR